MAPELDLVVHRQLVGYVTDVGESGIVPPCMVNIRSRRIRLKDERVKTRDFSVYACFHFYIIKYS